MGFQECIPNRNDRAKWFRCFTVSQRGGLDFLGHPVHTDTQTTMGWD